MSSIEQDPSTQKVPRGVFFSLVTFAAVVATIALAWCALEGMKTHRERKELQQRWEERKKEEAEKAK